MHERLEEILEATWKASEIGEFSVDAIQAKCVVDVNPDDLAELERQGYLKRTGSEILFSAAGKAAAEKITRRHRLAEVLVHSILRLKDTQMEEVACKVEHTLLPEVEEAICTLLGHPEVCPDGKPIPPGTCCRDETRTVSNVVSNLTDLEPGESGKICYIKPSDHSQLHQLLSFGLSPGTLILIHRTVPALCIKFENTELALDEEIGKNIFVVKAGPSPSRV
jgi:DtxR family Mn-dependent transcriptional regulator